ncbi:GIY-YIG nuclease family protein [Ornithinimicrobium faecis]|uniref:GIY-YIG nuclease family protein n=1 Tax=Ornithinimicrobium faecis TaxID=2934158 RepID=A0ABY4YRJ7_9MICO|nr:GIY-YIG nuclease family protein [Ornithinimicrobium sp. HY1793]USQ79202.1 GIY-YIG nuclease family protein [Ornithinimicrobium sp. HY1793]
MTHGRQVRLYLVDGTAGGLITAEIMNWTGHLVSASRSDLGRLLKRGEPYRTGIYILIGETGEPDAYFDSAIYVGEGDDISTRLKAHARPAGAGGKDFWDRVIIVTSKDANLTKAHARFLESRLIHAARSAGRSTVTNGNSPPPIQLPEADVSDMEYFLSQIHTLLPVLAINQFKVLPNVKPPTLDHELSPTPTDVTHVSSVDPSEISPTFILRISTAGIEADAREIQDEFTVLAGSTARSEWKSKTKSSSYASLHDKLLKNGTLVKQGDIAFFTSDTPFNAPSAAASVVAGTNMNGRTAWRHETTKITFGEWQMQGLESQ